MLSFFHSYRLRNVDQFFSSYILPVLLLLFCCFFFPRVRMQFANNLMLRFFLRIAISCLKLPWSLGFSDLGFILLVSWTSKDSSVWLYHRRTGSFLFAKCTVNHLAKNRKIVASWPYFYETVGKKTRVWCTNIGLHMKWKYCYIWVYYISS